MTLTQEEREELEGIVSKSRYSSQVYCNAYTLLNCDEGQFGDKINGKVICRVLKVNMRMIDRVKSGLWKKASKLVLSESSELDTGAKSGWRTGGAANCAELNVG